MLSQQKIAFFKELSTELSRDNHFEQDWRAGIEKLSPGFIKLSGCCIFLRRAKRVRVSEASAFSK